MVYTNIFFARASILSKHWIGILSNETNIPIDEKEIVKQNGKKINKRQTLTKQNE